ncbi:hypothetical protein DFH11DRAFT_1543354 [Phellopilus nigrolimitatus]|nr:hypothetical protein DFH11DRAFT_1543354 [Phellopilus nigrolimitatus]
MDSSALPSETQIQKLGYHELRTLARKHGLKATGPREEIRERLLKWHAEIGPERNLVGHNVDNEGAASCSASSSGSSTKENVVAPQETTLRKRKAEEMDPEIVPAERQSKRILVDSVVINTDVPPPSPSSKPAQPLPTLLSSLPESPPPSSPNLSPPFPPQCPGIRQQRPLPKWSTMFFTQDPSGWPWTVRPVSDWEKGAADAWSEAEYNRKPDDDSDPEW